MSPLQAPPSFGYVDGQRVQNYDGPILLDVTTPGTNASFISPVFDVSRYSHLSGFMLCNLANCGVLIQWYADAAATQFLGNQVFTLDSNMGNRMQPRISNMGPFVTVAATNFGGVPFRFIARVIATNRDDPLQMVPSQPWLILNHAAAVANSATDTVYPTDYYAGPARVNLSFSGANWIVGLQQLDLGGTWRTFDSQQFLAASNGTDINVTVPQGAWRWVSSNFTGALNNVNVSIQQTVTGSL